MSNAEDFVLRLHEQVSPGAKAAESALAQLEARIKAQQKAIGGYEEALSQAAQKLQQLGQGDARGAVNVAQFRRQQAVVEGLQRKIDDANASLEKLSGAKPVAGQVAQLQKAEHAIREVADAYRELEARQKLIGSTGGNVDGITAAMARKRGELVRAQQAYSQMGGSASRVLELSGGLTGKVNGLATKTQGATVNLGELGGKLYELGGPLGSAGGKAATLGESFQVLGRLGPAGIIAGIAIAVVALTAVLIAAVVAATKFAVSMADVARTQRLSLESLRINHKALADLETILPRVQRRTGLATDELERMATELAKAKVPAKNMEAALSAVATATAGGASAEFLDKLRRSLVQTGKVAPELAEQFIRFERVAGQRMLSLDKQGERMKRNVGGLFADLKIEPLLVGLSKIVALFDANTASGAALKFLLERFFQPLIDSAARSIPRIEGFFLGITINALRAYIGVKKFFKSADGQKLLETLETIKTVMEGIAKAGLGPGGAMEASELGGKLGAKFKGGDPATESAAQAKAAGPKNASLMNGIGMQMMAGLADGIVGGNGKVQAAIEAVTSGAVDAARNNLEVRSPSRVFYRIGGHIPEGTAQGVKAKAMLVHRAVTAMVRKPTEEVANDNVEAPRVVPIVTRDGGGQVIRLEFNHCTFGGDLDESKLEEMLVPILERNALAEEPT